MDTWMVTLALITPALALAALTLAWRGLHLAKAGRAEVAALHEHLRDEVREQVLAALEERRPEPAPAPVAPSRAVSVEAPREPVPEEPEPPSAPVHSGPSEAVRRRALEIARTAWETAQYLGLEHLAGREPNVYKLSLPCGSETDREALAHLARGALPCIRSVRHDSRATTSTLVIDLGTEPPSAEG